MFVRVLMAVDQFDERRATLSFTAALASATGCEVIVLTVREQARRSPHLNSLTAAHNLVAEALFELRLAGVGAEGEVRDARQGRVAQILAEEAARWHCDAIVLGSRRLRGLARWSGQGVREQLLRLSDLPVVTAPTLTRLDHSEVLPTS